MIITLTDFGNTEYLGVMKGVILSTNENARITDLYNNILPQNIIQGSWILYKNYRFFPKGSVFLCVVDPGVGSSRKAIAIKTKDYYFVGPDNGLMYPAANNNTIQKIYKLPTEDAHPTFHGRDVFAKYAALIDKHSLISTTITDRIKKLDFLLYERQGIVVNIDNFGNIITNIPIIKNKTSYAVKFQRKTLKLPFFKTYSLSGSKNLFLTESSYNTLEIAINGGSASYKLVLKIGDKITIE